MSNLTQFYQAGQGAVNTVTVFAYSGTWVAPPGVTRATVLVWGGGGSGACNTNYTSGLVSFGGGGGGFVKGIVAVTPGTSYSITVGAGAVMNTTQGANGTAGGTSSFSTLLTATGGGAGLISSYPTSGTGSSSGALWTFTAAGGGSGSNRASTGNAYGCGGCGSGSPFGDGGTTWTNLTAAQATGGGGWGGNSTAEPNLNDYQSLSPFATGGGGLMNGGGGYGGGGGGSSAPGQHSGTTSNFPTVSSQSVFMCTPGGNAPSAPMFLMTATTPNFISLGGWPQIEQQSASYFDILNCNLMGAGGYGVPPQNFVNYDPINYAGNGGAGGGGGGLFAVATGATNLKMYRAGNGGTGGGGGGIYIGSTSPGQSGTGGFGGGGGGFYSAAGNNYYAGGGGMGGGGGGGGSHGLSTGNFVAGGFGGRGCVLIFYRAT